MAEKKEIKAKTGLEKLMHIQSKLSAPKNQHNKFGNFNYRSCEDILEAVKPLLKEVEAVLLLNDNIELVGDRYYIHVQAIFRSDGDDIVTGAYAREPEARKGMDVSQITGSTSSYARKYALNGLFAIDDAKDSDATNNGKANEKPKEKFQNILDLAYKKFGEKHALYIEEHDNVTLDYDKFVKAIVAPKPKGFGKLPTVVGAIPQILEKIKLSDVMVETKKEEQAPAPSEPDKNPVVEQAFFNFQTENKDDLAEGFVYDKGLFEKAIIKHFKKLPAEEAGIPQILKKIKPVEVIKEL